jgi:hypothetical protein
MGQPDSAIGAGGEDRLRQFGGLGIVCTVGLVVEVVELGRGSVACFSHFELHQRSDCFDMIGR